MVGEREQIDRRLAGEQRDVRLPANGREHGFLDGAPGAVGVVDDAREGVGGLGRQVKCAAWQHEAAGAVGDRPDGAGRGGV